MPIFDFSCQKCGHRFTTLHLAGEKKPACAACGSTKLEQEFAPTNLAKKVAGKSARTLEQKGASPAGKLPTASEGHRCGPGCGHHKKADNLIRKKFGN